jgi:type II secretion system protein N
MRLPFTFPKELPRWQRITGYSLFGVVFFVLSLFLTFPHQAFWALVTENAARAGYDVKVGDYGGGLSGITGYRVLLMKSQPPDSTEPGMAMMIDELNLSPTLLPPGLSFQAEAFGGSISGYVEGFSLIKLRGAPPQSKDNKEDRAGSANVRLELDGVDLSKGQFKDMTGIDMQGKLDGNLALEIPIVGMPGARAYILDTGLASGKMTLNSPSLVINGGTLKGDFPLDLPKVNLGELKGELNFDNGAGTLETFRIKSDELDVQAGGTVKLKRQLEYSEPAIDFKVKLEKALSQRLGIVAAGLSALAPDKQDPDYRAGRLTGFLNKPRLGPAR